jgi:glycosyltransferase involved in cell wall biosynthesis
LTSSPVVSVLITAYNREASLARAIDSVLRSSFTNFELIVVDDASQDRTLEVARAHAAADERISVYVNEGNLGDYSNRNRAASYAKGEYIKYVDSDDFIYPHGLDVMVKCMDAFREAGLGLSAVYDPAGPYPRLLSPVDAYRTHYFKQDLLGRAPGSTIVRRAAFEELGGFSGRNQIGDHEMWLRMARRFPVVKMPTDLIWDGVHPDQQKYRDNAVDRLVMHEEVMLTALRAEDCPLPPEERDAARDRLERGRLRSYWHLLRSGGGFPAAEAYRRKKGMPLLEMLASARHFPLGS